MMSQLQNTNLIEIYQMFWYSNDFDSYSSQTMNLTQPFAQPLFLISTEIRFSHGDPLRISCRLASNNLNKEHLVNDKSRLH
jgi:hypothetical protein